MARHGSRIRLLPPYREHLAQAFARQFMRIGLPSTLPDFPYDKKLSDLVRKLTGSLANVDNEAIAKVSTDTGSLVETLYRTQPNKSDIQNGIEKLKISAQNADKHISQDARSVLEAIIEFAEEKIKKL